jgi:anti-anti-sigma regulatory factor
MANSIVLPSHLVIQVIDEELDKLGSQFSSVDKDLVIDAGGLEKIDTCGAQTLITFLKDIPQETSVEWKSLSESLKEELTLSGLADSLKIK